MMSRRRGRSGQGGGVYGPLMWACIFLLCALCAWAVQKGFWARGAIEPDAEIVLRPKSATAIEGEAARWSIAMYDAQAGEVRALPIEEYIVGVVAAEMPASFHEQALCAQAVAARTRAVASMRRLGGSGCNRRDDADVCSDSAHCQAWASDDELRQRWGEEYASLRTRVAEAVHATSGQVMTYAGEPILVLYHAVSGGATEDVEHVFAQALPYLRGVESPGEEAASRYESEQRFSCAQAAEALNAAFPKAGLTADGLSAQLAVEDRFDSGRVGKVRLGKAMAEGTEFRRALGLYSTNFTLTFEQGELVIRQRGYGHGVGMSQVGADAMARAGQGYTAILRHYYVGVLIEQW